MSDARQLIGFIGLGAMGEAMALNLVKSGTPLVVWNRTPAKAQTLAAVGAELADEAADVFAHSQTVILMLADSRAMDTVLARGDRAFADRVKGRTGSVQKVLQKKEVMVRGWISKPQPRIEP
jgi:3-hydroxyisobutyrate dehydrogenase